MNTNTARQREYDGTASPSLFTNEWAVVQQAIAGMQTPSKFSSLPTWASFFALPSRCFEIGRMRRMRCRMACVTRIPNYVPSEAVRPFRLGFFESS